jgi:hypothetical protein
MPKPSTIAFSVPPILDVDQAVSYCVGAIDASSSV